MHETNETRFVSGKRGINKWKLNSLLTRGKRVASLNLGKGAHGGLDDGTSMVPETLDELLSSLGISWCALQELKIPHKTDAHSKNYTYFLKHHPPSDKNNPIRGVGFAVNNCYVKSIIECKQKELSSSHNTLLIKINLSNTNTHALYICLFTNISEKN